MQSKLRRFSVVAAVLAATSTYTALADATVYVVHGIPGADLGLAPALPVDVSINGDCALPGFEFGDIAGPLSVPAGSYDIAIGLADPNEPCGADPVISANGIELADDTTYSIVAHLAADGTPTASVFVNETRAFRNIARVNLYHTAAAPAVDVLLKNTDYWWLRGRFLRDVENGDQAALYLLAGNYDATIFPAGSRDPVFGPAPLSTEEKTAYAVYAVGSLANDTFTLLVHPLADPEPALVYVVHGIPGADLGLDPALPVDVSINGDCALPGFEFGQIVGPVELAAGSYDINIGLADENAPCSADAVITADGIELEGGKNYSIVAHLTEDGAPTASVFENNLRASRFGARVNVFHTAAAPTVDVLFERFFFWFSFPFLLEDISNGESADRVLFRGPYDVSILPTGASDPVFGPVELELEANTAYLIYAVGTLANDTFTVLVQPVSDDE